MYVYMLFSEHNVNVALNDHTIWGHSEWELYSADDINYDVIQEQEDTAFTEIVSGSDVILLVVREEMLFKVIEKVSLLNL